MGSFIEKITLYDLLAYTLPGSILLVVVLSKWEKEIFDILIKYKDYKGCLVLLFIAIGYICGIMVSELSRWLNIMYTFIAKKVLHIKKPCNLEEKMIAKALVNAQLVEDASTITDPVSEVEKYYSYMYGDIQTDNNYMRIHNYASAGSMYKNMALVSVASTIFLIKYYGCHKQIIMVGIICFLIFTIRWIRFDKKVRTYTLNWFIKKHIT